MVPRSRLRAAGVAVAACVAMLAVAGCSAAGMSSGEWVIVAAVVLVVVGMVISAKFAKNRGTGTDSSECGSGTWFWFGDGGSSLATIWREASGGRTVSTATSGRRIGGPGSWAVRGKATASRTAAIKGGRIMGKDTLPDAPLGPPRADHYDSMRTNDLKDRTFRSSDPL